VKKMVNYSPVHIFDTLTLTGHLLIIRIGSVVSLEEVPYRHTSLSGAGESGTVYC